MKLIALLLIVAAAAGASPAQVPLTTSAVRVTAPWKVAGVGLGMTPAEVGPALKAAGYSLDYRYMGRSWQGELASQVSFLRAIKIPGGAQVVRKEDYKKGQEFIQVEYLAGPAGPYVAQVRYRISSEAIEAERFRAAGLSRYGRPSLKWDWESLYCSAGELQCSRTGSLVTNQLPNLTVYVMDGMNRSLELRQGQRADRAWEAALKAEVERLYPKKDRPSF
ncbi:MAG TPA: hypothetical protein VF574_08210 [Allosphingosinicella sp.]|jgi:hypothetical protein